VRCGDTVAGLRLGDGALQWSRRVGLEDIESKQFAATKACVVSSLRGPAGRSLVALAWSDGAELWNAPISGSVVDQGIAATEKAVYVVTTDDSASRFRLHELSAESGEEGLTIDAPLGAGLPLVINDQVFFASSAFDSDEAGLYVLDPEEQTSARILEGPVGALRPGTDSILVARTAPETGDFEVVAVSLTDFTQRWSAPSYEYMLDTDAGQVAHLESVGTQRNRAVLRDTGTGDVIWRGDELASEGLFVFFSGDAVCIQDETGITFLDRTSGKNMARLDSPKWTFSWGGAVLPGRLVLGHGSEVICYESEHHQLREEGAS
jgi:outer membrane protein assembly factor BamB